MNCRTSGLSDQWTVPMLTICRKPRLSVDYSCISYKIGHACRKLNYLLISRLTGKRETQDLKKLTQFLWTHQGAKIKIMILA